MRVLTPDLPAAENKGHKLHVWNLYQTPHTVLEIQNCRRVSHIVMQIDRPSSSNQLLKFIRNGTLIEERPIGRAGWTAIGMHGHYHHAEPSLFVPQHVHFPS